MRGRFVILAMLVLPACDPLIVRETTPVRHSASESEYGEAHEAHEAAGTEAHDEHSEAVIPVPDSLTSAQSQVDVFPKGSNPSRRTMVVGVIDVHTAAEDPDKGFDVLRVVAARLGADAVIGAEFEHGEGSEPSHLSGMAVRYIDGG